MSYGAGLLTTQYPSTLLSDGYFQRPSYETPYPPSMSYMNNTDTDRLFNDDLSYNPMQTRSYGLPQTNGYNPKPMAHPPPQFSKDGPDSLMSMNDITEYSESMGTASNTNTASSVARTIEEPTLYGPTKKPYQPPTNPTWNQKAGPTMNNKKKPPMDDSKHAPQYRAAPKPSKKPALNRSQDDSTPVPESQAHHGTRSDVEQTSRAMNIEAWLNETNNGSPPAERSAEQAWSDKINQLEMAKVQREKDKVKSSRALPVPTKKFEPKSNTNQTRQNMNKKSQEKPPGPYSHFDTLFDGDFYRPTNYSSHPNYNPPAPKPKPRRSKPPPPPPDYSLDEYGIKPSKHIPPSRTSRYEPPTSKRPPHGISTTSWRSNWPRNYLYDSYYPYYLHPDYLHHEYIHKGEEERYREALQVMRAERAEQQQKQIVETTAKRLTYGDYVRNSTKEGSLPNPVKPSPWSDFMDLKKGNIYDISREEKKQLYHQSKSYGERVRHRNVGFSDTDLALSYRASMPYLDDDIQEPPTSNVTPRQTKHDGTSKSISRTSKHRPDSASTKRTNVNRNPSNPDSRNNRYHRSEDDQGTQSDTGVSQKSKRSVKKKNVHYGRHDTSGRATSGAEDSDTEVEDRSVRSKFQSKNPHVHTIKEERTLESIEAAQYRKVNPKQKK